MAVKFFCENCKFEVPLDSSTCPYCGKSFYSVYCPRCRKEGTPAQFKNGCPSCGYLKENYKSSRRASYKFREADSRRRRTGLPRWFYSLAIVVLTLGIIGLLVMIALGVKLP